MANWTFDPETFTYLSEGLSIDASGALELSNVLSKESFNVMQKALRDHFSGKLSLSDFSKAIKSELKSEFIRQYILGTGGRSRMTPKDWGSLGGNVRVQYKYFDKFVKQLSNETLSEKVVINRLRLYSNSCSEMFHQALERTHIQNGFLFEKWIIGDTIENCDDCLLYASAGVMPIGTFPIPRDGYTACMNNCGCHKEYQMTKERGGKGSGNFGHGGRIGKVGGSSTLHKHGRTKPEPKGLYEALYIPEIDDLSYNVKRESLALSGRKAVENLVTRYPSMEGEILKIEVLGSFVSSKEWPPDIDFLVEFKTYNGMKEFADNIAPHLKSSYNSDFGFWTKELPESIEAAKDYIKETKSRYDADPINVSSWINEFSNYEERGGKGSGNFGHSGRPGKIGGSTSKNIKTILNTKNTAIGKSFDPQTFTHAYYTITEAVKNGKINPLSGNTGKEFYLSDLGHSEQDWETVQKLFYRHGLGGDMQFTADERIVDLLFEESSTGDLMRDISETETYLLEEYDNSFDAYLYRRGDIMNGHIECWTLKQEGASTQFLGGESSIIPNKEMRISDMLSKGYISVGGIGRMTGAPGESEVTMLFIPEVKRGGPTSGNFGHKGRPGEVGGSASSSMYIPMDTFVRNRVSMLRPEQRAVVENAICMQDEKTGYRTTVVGIEHQFFRSGETISIQGKIEDRMGTEIGNISFRILNADLQNNEVYIELFSMQAHTQNAGFATRYLENLERTMMSQGNFNRITLQANLTVGGYAWARLGFEPEYPFALNNLKSRVIDQIYNTGHLVSTDLETSINEIDNIWDLSVYEYMGEPVGKKALLGSSWDAVKELNPDSLGYKVGQAYYEVNR